MYKTIITGIQARDAYETHKIVAGLFDSEPEHVWRRDGEMVTVISKTKPAGSLSSGMCLGSFEVAAPVAGDTFPIMLRVNACRHVGKKLVPLTPREIPAWLAERMPGVILTGVVVAPESTEKATKAEHEITLRGCSVSAMVEVIDGVEAARAFSAGVGRARRFGYGLVLPLR